MIARSGGTSRLAKSAANMNQSQLQASATSYFLANLHRPEAQNPQVTATYSHGSNGFVVTVIR